jgi:hypothetical protein
MVCETLIQAALAVLTAWEREDENLSDDLALTMDRLALAAHRRCETCVGWTRHREGVDHGQCGTQTHNPPRNSFDTCARWQDYA